MKNADLTHAQRGAFLMAVGAAMVGHAVPADELLHGPHGEQLLEVLHLQGIPSNHAVALLTDLIAALHSVNWSGA